jgi:hypothetical protein
MLWVSDSSTLCRSKFLLSCFGGEHVSLSPTSSVLDVGRSTNNTCLILGCCLSPLVYIDVHSQVFRHKGHIPEGSVWYLKQMNAPNGGITIDHLVDPRFALLGMLRMPTI